MPTVTIGFVPRQRFSHAAEALQRIFDCTHVPFTLVVVDCNIPQIYRQQMEKVLCGRNNVQTLRTDDYLLPNEARNLVIQACQDDLIGLLDNDVLVDDGWLSRLIVALDEYPADVAVPLIMEERPGSSKSHFDESLGHIQSVQSAADVKFEICPVSKKPEGEGGRRSLEMIETHCLLCRRQVFDRIGVLDAMLSTSEEIALSLTLHHTGIPIVFEPKAVVHFIQPSFPLAREDKPYFLMRWDIDRAVRSHERIVRKWNLMQMPQQIAFVKEHYLRGADGLRVWRDELTSIIPENKSFILVDQEEWRETDIVKGLKTIPFLEHDGIYWGPPLDSEMAIRELERLQQAGAQFMVFAWYGFWYLDYYSGLRNYLHSRFPCVLQNDHLIIYDLRAR